MIDQSVKFEVIKLLKTLPVCIVSTDGTQYTTRCQYCGDSRHESHGHFSIKIDTESDIPMMYRCLKCDMKGLLNDDLLEDFGFYVDNDLHSALRMFNRKAVKKYGIINIDIENFNVPIFHNTYTNQKKLDYICNRIGADINMEEAKELKIVLSLFDFMKFNDIKTLPGFTFNQLQTLNDSYAGFLSTNNNCIIFRNITDNNKLMRYFKLQINPKNINSDTFYSIPNSLDVMYTNDINIRIAEGTFDILSIYKNIINSKENELFFAGCGFGSNTILSHLIHHGINTGLNTHIYSDNDKSDYEHKKNLFKNSSLHCWTDHIYIHRNGFDHEKDFGVPLNQIIDTRCQLK